MVEVDYGHIRIKLDKIMEKQDKKLKKEIKRIKKHYDIDNI